MAARTSGRRGRAQIELETAIRLDPNLAEAYADLSSVHLDNYMPCWVANRAGALATAFALAQQGVGLDERSSRCRRALGPAHLFRREHGDADCCSTSQLFRLSSIATKIVATSDPAAGAVSFRLSMRLLLA